MAYRKLGRDSSARKALFRSMLTSFFACERIETTEAKAKEVSKLADQNGRQIVHAVKTDIFHHLKGSTLSCT